MYWWPEAPNPQTMVPRFGQYNSSSSSDSASRGWHWNRGRVQYQLPCLKWTQNPNNWETLYQRQCPVFRNSWFFQGVGLSFIPKLQATTETTGWLHSGTSNQNWGFIQGGTYSNTSFAWVNTLPACLYCMPRSPVNPRVAARLIRDEFLCRRCRERMRITTTSCNPIVNTRIYCRGDNQEGPVTQ